MKFLVIEDNTADFNTVNELIRSSGQSMQEILRARSLVDMFNLVIRNGAFDIILANLKTADSTGIDTFNAITTILPGIPLVILADHINESLIAMTRNRGMCEYLLKEELSVRTVAEVIARCMEHKAPRVKKRRKTDADNIRLLESVVININEPVIITSVQNNPDDELQTIYVNKAFVRFTGYSHNDIYGKSPKILQGPKTDRAELDRIRESLQQWKSVEAELLNYRKDGSEFWVRLNIVPVMGEGGVYTHWIAIQRDITEVKREEFQRKRQSELLERDVNERTQQLIEANKELEAFNYSVSHDLRTPIRALEIYTGVLESEFRGVNEEYMGYIGQMQRCLTEMKELIDDLLTFSKMGKAILSIETIDVSRLVTQIFNSLKIIENDDRAVLQFQDMPQMVADLSLMKIVFNNLISNAMKYSSHVSRPRIIVGGKRTKNFLLYWVKDNGIGFDEKHAESLFKPFVRLHTNQEYKGNGAGLAIVERIISRHDGRVWAKAKPGEGATFYFQIPIRSLN